MEKPITIQIEETKNEIIEVINNSNLHPFILDAILKDIYNEIHILYASQIEQDKKEYEQSKSQKKSTE